MGTAAEQLLNGMYRSEILLAIPLFILAAEFMNTGSITERLLRYALVADTSVGHLFLGGVVPGILAGLAQMALIAVIARRRGFPVEPHPAPRPAGDHVERVPRAPDTGGAPRRHLRRGDHAHRGRRGRRSLRAGRLGRALPQRQLAGHLRRAEQLRAGRPR
jgi:hypothetical protein